MIVSSLHPRIRRRVRALYAHRALGVRSWRAHFRAVSALEATLHQRPVCSPDADVVLTMNSFRRPQNLELLCWLALRAPSVRRVVISSNDPAVDLGAWIHLDDPRIEIRASPTRRGPLSRYLLARDIGGGRFLSIDDDLFFHPEQLEALIARLRAEPEVPHGFYGQLYDRERRRFRYNRGRGEGRVDILNRAYAFTDAHLSRYFELLDALSMSEDERRAFTMDDVVLGFTAQSRPLVHELGDYVDCASEHDPSIAIFRARGEHERRRALFERLERIAGRPERGGADAPALRRGPSPRGLAAAVAYYGSGLGLVVDGLYRLADRVSA
jgi:hypothetical protein